MDPELRALIETAWEAFDDDPDDLPPDDQQLWLFEITAPDECCPF